MMKNIDILVNVASSDFVRRQVKFNRKAGLLGCGMLIFSAAAAAELKKLRETVEDLKRSNYCLAAHIDDLESKIARGGSENA